MKKETPKKEKCIICKKELTPTELFFCQNKCNNCNLKIKSNVTNSEPGANEQKKNADFRL